MRRLTIFRFPQRGGRADKCSDAAEPNKVRVMASGNEVPPNGWGTHTAFALRLKTAPSLFERTGEFQPPCLLTELPAGRP